MHLYFCIFGVILYDNCFRWGFISLDLGRVPLCFVARIYTTLFSLLSPFLHMPLLPASFCEQTWPLEEVGLIVGKINEQSVLHVTVVPDLSHALTMELVMSGDSTTENNNHK